MKTSPLSILLALGFFGEAIIIASFLLLGEAVPEKYLCMAISSVIYFLWMWQVFFPWINLKDKANREVGSLGIQWLGIFLYSASAIAAMVVCNFPKLATFINIYYEKVPFEIQIIIHAILLFALFAALLLSKGAKDKVADIYEKETALTEKKDEIKIALNNLKRKLSLKNSFPQQAMQRIAKLEDEARYISPNNSPQAQSLDNSFIESLKKFETKSDFGNLEQIEIDEILNLCEITLAERKKILN